jgi:hypothetical protein
MNTKNKKKFNSGIALLFSIMLSMIFLTVAVGVLNIAVKELNFSTSGKNTNDAFFAADSGVECALFNDKSSSTFFVNPDVEGYLSDLASFTCFGEKIDLKQKYPNFDFTVIGLGSNNISCAKVNVLKTFDEITDIISTKITSKGYNIDGDSKEKCGAYNSNSIERVLEVTY